MWIYKITNSINNKVYIGQSARPVEQRFHRHIQDAESGRLDTHLARAIRKYGKENFHIEIIDEATSQEELTKKEYYWIGYYHATEDGYNETDAEYKCGGNTYKSKSEDEMRKISEKIRQSKIGGKNPQSKKVKCKSLVTGKEYHFDSLSEMQSFFGASNHNFITRRCRGTIKCAYEREWLIAYEENDYPTNFTIEKGNRRSKKIKITNLETNEINFFESYAAAERNLSLTQGFIADKAYKEEKVFQRGNLLIEVLN